MSNSILRPEYPNPQFCRADWLNLNGEWQFETDNSRSGIARGLFKDNVSLSGTITVPFCPESKLSGVENKDFMAGVWYKRTFTLTETRAAERVLLHFGAVDYRCVVYVNEKEAGRHNGGYVSFAFNVSSLVKPGINTVAVYAEDDPRDPLIPRGKQSEEYFSHACVYTRTTGIWQTVWLEFMPQTHIESVKFYPNIGDGSVTVKALVRGSATLSAEVTYKGKSVGEYTTCVSGGEIVFCVALSEKHLWEVGHGRLYDVRFTYGDDCVNSYFGLRNVRLDGFRFLLNEKSVFQRLVLDQGFYPDGIYTAPTDEALRNDIALSMQFGFNGARLHQKVFEQRFLYYCDKMGYIVWGEYPDWGLDCSKPEAVLSMLPEWTEVVERDFNHPAIIGWCPHNETWDKNNTAALPEAIRLIYRTTKAFDTTRPCIDTSGGFHVETDIFDTHDYCQNPEKFNESYQKLITDNELYDIWGRRQHYGGEPTFISEYGGIHWSSDKNSWGYGEGPKTEEEFIERFRGLTNVLMKNKKMLGLCYTQLTDVEQEQNGLMFYDRKPKFDPALFRAVLSRPAAIEKE